MGVMPLLVVSKPKVLTDVESSSGEIVVVSKSNMLMGEGGTLTGMLVIEVSKPNRFDTLHVYVIVLFRSVPTVEFIKRTDAPSISICSIMMFSFAVGPESKSHSTSGCGTPVKRQVSLEMPSIWVYVKSVTSAFSV